MSVMEQPHTRRTKKSEACSTAYIDTGDGTTGPFVRTDYVTSQSWGKDGFDKFPAEGDNCQENFDCLLLDIWDILRTTTLTFHLSLILHL